MNKKEYQFYINADRIISGRPANSLKRTIKLLFFPDHIQKFMLLLRKVEYLSDKPGVFKKIKLFIATYRFKKISLRLGFSIPTHVFGPGLYIPHYGTIVVNENTKVGANCVLHTSTCIAGSELKILGNNVYISTGAIILGEVTIADNVTISANTMVNKSFLNKNMLIGGTPAKELKDRKAWFELENERFGARVADINKLYKSMIDDK
jgi:serine O-acetyltransferase